MYDHHNVFDHVVDYLILDIDIVQLEYLNEREKKRNDINKLLTNYFLKDKKIHNYDHKHKFFDDDSLYFD